MTTQNAIDYFKAYMEFCKESGLDAPTLEPYEIAIEAMEKQIKEKNLKIVSNKVEERVLSILEYLLSQETITCQDRENYTIAMNDIKIAQIYTAIGEAEEFKYLKEKQMPHGLYYEADGYADGELVYDMAYCPDCGHGFEYGINGWGSNYCPNCGLKLELEGLL